MPRNEFIACMIIAVVTFLIRALPFILTDVMHRSTESRFLNKLSDYLTPALIGMLVVYCLKDVSFKDASALASAIALSVCVVSYVIKRNTLISIVVPTILYMVLIRVL